MLQQERLGPPAARGRGGTPNWVALGGTGGLSPRRGPQEQKAADRSWRTGAGKAAAAAADRRLLQARQPDCKRMSSSSELGGCEPTAFQRLSRPADLLRALNKAHRLQTRAAAPCRLTQGLQTLGQPPGSAPRPPIHPLLKWRPQRVFRTYAQDHPSEALGHEDSSQSRWLTRPQTARTA